MKGVQQLSGTISAIRMGDFAVSANDGVLRTLLGSCIGLALYDHTHKVGGLAHIVLPQSRDPGGPAGKFVDTAIPALYARMEALAGRSLKPTARIAGGANMFSTTVNETIGTQNIEATERLLGELRIRLLGRHCGGEKGRRMSLDTSTGVITIEIVGSDPIEL